MHLQLGSSISIVHSFAVLSVSGTASKPMDQVSLPLDCLMLFFQVMQIRVLSDNCYTSGNLSLRALSEFQNVHQKVLNRF